MAKAIKINCEGTEYLSLKELEDFQGDLKKLNIKNKEKLKNSIIKNGFIAPIFIWQAEDKNYILDGHQRLNVLKDLAKEYEIPKIPTVKIFAKNKKEAKEKLLHISSQYGEFDLAGLNSFIDGLNIENVVLLGKEIDFNINFNPVGIEEQGRIDKIEKSIMICPNCGFEYEK